MTRLLLCFIFSSLALLNNGLVTKHGIKYHNNQLKSTQLNLFGKKTVVAEVVKNTVAGTATKSVAVAGIATKSAAVAGTATKSAAVAGTAATSATSCTNGGLCAGLASLKLKFMSTLSGLIGIYSLIYLSTCVLTRCVNSFKSYRKGMHICFSWSCCLWIVVATGIMGTITNI